MKLPIKLVMIGHIDRIINFDLIKKHKSKLFTIEELNRINDLPSSKKDNGYLDIVYSVDEIKDILSNIECNGICIGIMNYKFEDNFYMHNIDKNKICISVADLEQILQRKNISLENFIIKNIYEIFSFYKMFGSESNEEAYKFVHEDTRGCLFDLNGDKNDIIYNTEQPIICNECLSKINKKAMPDSFIPIIKSELKNINKPLIQIIELFIKKNPLLSVGITFIFSILINIFSNFIWLKIAGT